jgi:hypothetical protein
VLKKVSLAAVALAMLATSAIAARSPYGDQVEGWIAPERDAYDLALDQATAGTTLAEGRQLASSSIMVAVHLKACGPAGRLSTFMADPVTEKVIVKLAKLMPEDERNEKAAVLTAIYGNDPARVCRAAESGNRKMIEQISRLVHKVRALTAQ